VPAPAVAADEPLVPGAAAQGELFPGA